METKKQRREIYLKAAKLIDNRVDDFCCLAIMDAVNDFGINGKLEKLFPEFYLFNPMNFTSSWFGDTTNQNKLIRITALLFAAEMCKEL